MEGSMHKEEYVPDFDVKIGAESSWEAIKTKFLNGGMIQFIAAKNLSLYLTNLGHDELRFKNGINWDEILFYGAFFWKDGKMTIYYYGGGQKGNVKVAINKVLTGFFQSLISQTSSKEKQ